MSNVLLILAGRNLWRQKRRTLLTCLAIAFGIFMLIFLDSLLGGFDESGTKNLIDLQTGHLQIMSQEQFDAKNLTLDHLFVPEPHWETFNNLPGVEGAAGRIFFPVRLNTGWEEYSVVGVGIDPEQDPRVFDLPTYLHGQWLAPGEGGMLLGRRTAELLDLEIGDYLTAVTRTADGAFQALDFQLVGILATPHPQLDQGMAFFPMDVIDEGLALRGQISEISLRVEPGRLGDVQRAVGSL
ncbi:MAG: ABC transporter permease, partial [Limnochordia bacterium]